MMGPKIPWSCHCVWPSFLQRAPTSTEQLRVFTVKHALVWAVIAITSLESSSFVHALTQLESDTAALVSFKQVADPDGFLADWKGASGVCKSWTGVTCEIIGGVQRVTGLNVADVGLAEVALPAALSNLTALTVLDVTNNNFEGELPDYISSMTSLVSLNLGLNFFNGTVSNKFENLTSLTALDLSSNFFTGSIPSDSLGALSSLTSLILAENNFNASFPESLGNLSELITLNLGLAFGSNSPQPGPLPSSFSKLTKLQTLALSTTGLSGDIDDLPFASLSSLKSLQLNSNNLSGGPVPTWLANLTSLTDIDFSANPSFTPGRLPSDAGFWPKTLTNINLQQTNLMGSIPPILGSLPLSFLKLRSNNLTGSIPPELGKLASDGIELDLAVNSLSGPVPIQLGNVSYALLDLKNNTLNGSLTAFAEILCTKNSGAAFTLDISNNNLNGELPSLLGKCKQLTLLSLSFNSFTGSIPSSWGQFKSLSQGLFLSNNQLTGQIPGELAGIPAVSQVDFSFNNLSGPIPEAFSCSQQTLTDFNAANNSLTGGIPSRIGECSSLSSLNLQNNLLDGAIPSSLANMSSLMYLYLNGNRFLWSIPDIVDWSALLELNLSGNQLIGSIPTSLGQNAESLQVLNLGNNKLTGVIPSSLFGLKKLSSLDLSENQLSGPVPSQVKNAKALTRLSLRGNALNETLPLVALRQVSTLQTLDVRDNHIEGRISLNNTRLVRLLVAGNNFSGAIPQMLTKISSLSELNLSNNAFTGAIPDLPVSLTALDLSQNNLSGSIPTSMKNLTLLLTLDLSSNQLQGRLHADLDNLKGLQHLDVSGNKLNGTIPDRLGNLTKLTFFDASNNDFSGPIPAGLAKFKAAAFLENADLCGAPLDTACPAPVSSPPGGGGGLSTGAKIGIIVGSVVGSILLIMILGCLARRTFGGGSTGFEEIDPEKPRNPGMFAQGSGFEVSGHGQMVIFQRMNVAFGIDQVLEATEDFDDKYLLGRGGFGSVYRASLGSREGRLDMAIKRLNPDSGQGEREFLAEMETLGKIRHRNLVSLLGTYSDPISKERLIIYNFVAGGDLAGALKRGMDWPTRLRVAQGSARGFKYLHHSCSPAIIHRDIKPENILLDEHMEAYVADFGLAKLIDIQQTHLSTKPLGTIGYLAPEYYSKHQITTKIDVYSFGIVLLQLVSGKSPISPAVGNNGLSIWAQRNTYATVVDDSIDPNGEYEAQIMAVLRLGILCTSRKAHTRPSMEDVVETLENLDDFAAHIANE